MENDEDKGKVHLAQALRFMAENWPGQLELIRYKAKVTRARYTALVAEGFSRAQAMDLCTRDSAL